MYKLNFDLFLEKVDFSSEDLKTDISDLKTYKLCTSDMIQDKINELHTEILKIKGDWVQFDWTNVGVNYYIKANIIFHHLNLEEHENEVVQNVIAKCDSIMENLHTLEEQCFDEKKPELLDNLISENGIIITAKEGGSWGIADSLAHQLASHNIPYQLIHHHQSRFDGGASGGGEDILLYIASSAASGITWDILKGMLVSKLGHQLHNFKTALVDRYKFKQLRITIAERIVEDQLDLVLTEFYEQDEEMILEFKVYGIIEKTITVICHTDYRIKELKVERN